MSDRAVPAARRCLVGGRVQGVCFRASTRDHAQSLGLRGYARNLEDGRVEVVAVGAEGDLDRLVEWLHRGPPTARVSTVQVETLSAVSATVLIDAVAGSSGTGFLTR